MDLGHSSCRRSLRAACSPIRILIDNRAFTFLELIAVLLIISIVSGVVLSRTSSVQGFQAQEEMDQIKSHLRYAQRRALKTNTVWGIQFNSSTTYWLFQGANANKKRLPDEPAQEITLRNLAVTTSPLTVTFDAYGSPGSTSVNIPTGQGTIVVQAGTGFTQ